MQGIDAEWNNRLQFVNPEPLDSQTIPGPEVKNKQNIFNIFTNYVYQLSVWMQACSCFFLYIEYKVW